MATITEDYCSKEIYRLLIKKGFNGEVHTTFDEEGYTQTSITLQMAMKWLREVHKIIPVILIGGDNQNPFYYWFRIDTIIDGKWKDAIYRENEVEFPSYEDACEAVIKYCLENLI